MSGTLNFCDDPTHVRVYGVREIANALIAKGVRVVKAGARRDAFRIALSPLILILLFVRGRPPTSILWDFLGFADFVFARKT